MKKCMKKMIAGFFLVMNICLPLMVYAASVGTVYDEAGLLSETEAETINNQITSLKETTGWDIFAVTTNDAKGKSAMAFADDYYDERTTEDSDGILLLIDMDNREIYLSTCGIAIRYLTDSRIESVLDAGYSYVSEGDYAGCFLVMLNTVARYYDSGIPENQYTYDVETGAISRYRVLTWMEVWPILLLSLGVGFGIYFGVKRTYSLKGGRYDYPYVKYGKVNLSVKEDQFIRKSVSQHRIQTSSSSGGHSSNRSSGRSSSHSSSSGRSHGGGGRKF